jgi:hypothetical protein
MNCKDIVWYYIEKSLNKKFFNSEVRELPIFLKPLRHDMLGDFRHTADGFNSIILADNAELKPIQIGRRFNSRDVSSASLSKAWM